MTDHTIEAHFDVSSAQAGPTTGLDAKEIQIIMAMAMAMAGSEAGASHPAVIFEAVKIYKAVRAMREAEMEQTRNLLRDMRKDEGAT